MLVMAVAGAWPAAAAVSPVQVDVSVGSNAYHIEGTFPVGVPVERAWCVLTDYEGISKFVRSVRVSRLETTPDGRQRLHQEAVAGMFIVRRRVQVSLELIEDPGRTIAFSDVLGRDFSLYFGVWTVEPEGDSTRVRYSLDAMPKMAIPLFGRSILAASGRDLLTEVRDEMLRCQREPDRCPRCCEDCGEGAATGMRAPGPDSGTAHEP